jgi:hypothetical protein
VIVFYQCLDYKQESLMKDPLSITHPQLAGQWHPTKNGEITPDMVKKGSKNKAWWQCPNGPDHEWEASIEKRVRGNGCPCCAGQRVSVTNSLASLYPDLAKQWHPTENGSLTPEQVVAGSTQKAWWKCPNGPHREWRASITGKPSIVGASP